MNKPVIYPDRQVTLLPTGANELIKTAASRKYIRPSQYVRDAVLHRLEQDGLQVRRQSSVIP
jgi:hypothetical protein